MANEYFTYSPAPRALPLVGSAHTPGLGDDHAASAYVARNRGFGSEYLGAGSPTATVLRAYNGASYDMQELTGIMDGEHNASIIWPNIRQVDSESWQNRTAPGESITSISTRISYPLNYGDDAGMNGLTTTNQGPVNVFDSAGGDIRQRRCAEARQKKPPGFICPRFSCGKAFTTKYRLASECIPCIHAYTAANATSSAHWNRFHAAPDSQQRFPCGSGDCDYITFYSTDLPRHRKKCKGRRQLTHPELNFSFSTEPAFNFNLRG